MRIYNLLPITLLTIGLVGAPVSEAQEELSRAKRLIVRAVALDTQGKTDEAIVLFNQAIELEPKNAMAYFDLGNSYEMGKHNAVQAKPCYQKAVELNPEYGKAWNALGLVCKELKEMPAAESASKRAVALEPTCGHLCSLAWLYLDTGRLKESREILLRANSLPEEAKSPELKKQIEENLAWLNQELSQKKKGTRVTDQSFIVVAQTSQHS